MKVAMVCPYDLSIPGGVQAQAAGLARSMVRHGARVKLIGPASHPETTSVADGVEFLAVGGTVGLRANGSVASVSINPMAMRRAARIVNGGGFELVHLHEPLAPGPTWGCLASCRQPMVGTFHRSGSSAAYRLLGPVARWAASRLAARFAVSEAARTTAQAALGGSYEVIGNGVDLEAIAQAQPWPSPRPAVLFVGRHEQRKGLSVLLEAFSSVELPPPGPQPVLWVAGEGPDTESLRRRFPPSDRLEWLGRITEEEKARRLVAATVFCAPSLRGESFGVVLIEAFAARTPVVATNLPGYMEVAGGHAELVPPGDPIALARALTRVLTDARSGTGMCSPGALEAAFRHGSRWSMDSVAKRYLSRYEELINSNHDGMGSSTVSAT